MLFLFEATMLALDIRQMILFFLIFYFPGKGLALEDPWTLPRAAAASAAPDHRLRGLRPALRGRRASPAHRSLAAHADWKRAAGDATGSGRTERSASSSQSFESFTVVDTYIKNTKRRIWLPCMCWPQTVPSTWIENLTSNKLGCFWREETWKT